jgi:hypothetical protein
MALQWRFRTVMVAGRGDKPVILGGGETALVPEFVSLGVPQSLERRLFGARVPSAPDQKESEAKPEPEEVDPGRDANHGHF